jgi:hypothetical protein
MPGVNLVNYTNLSKYGVLANNTITNTGSTTINNGNWYAPTITGTALTPSGSPSGINGPNATSIAALNELNLLITEITLYTGGLSSGANIGTGGIDITFSPNTNYTGAGITFVGKTITFDGENNSNAQFFITDTGTGMTFTNVTFILTRGAKSCNIYWLSNPTSGSGGFTVTTPATDVPGIIITTSTTGTSSSTFTITSKNIIGHIYSKTSVTFTSTGGVSLDSNTCAVVCYAKGTKILTKNGFMSIENIKTDDNVITGGKIIDNEYYLKDDFKLEPVTWISKFKVNRIAKESAPICISKHSLAKGFPLSDLYVSPCHGILWKGAIVRAKDLINGETIFQDFSNDSIVYYHLELESHSALIANGILSESYLELNNRQVFETPEKKYKMVKKSIKN